MAVVAASDEWTNQTSSQANNEKSDHGMAAILTPVDGEPGYEKIDTGGSFFLSLK